MLSNEFGKKPEISDDIKIEVCVRTIYNILSKDLNVVDCNDYQCDNEDCVLYRAVVQYMKYNQIKKIKNKMEKGILDYNEFIKIINCDGILRDFNITIEGNKYYRIEEKIEYLKPGESIFIGYNHLDFEIRYIKESNFSYDGKEVFIKLYNNNELENLYRDYLYYEFESVEYSDDCDITFYPSEGIDIDEVKKNGFKLEHHISYDVLSYENFLKNLKNKLKI